MSGFRKFRSTTQRRRRSVEAVELGYLSGPMTTLSPPPGQTGIGATSPRTPASVQDLLDAGHAPTIEIPASQEAVAIGPAPIAWAKRRKPGTDN